MPRRKVSMGLIPSRRMRVSTFGKRKEGLKKKANELSVLCGVEVALVVASADGDASAEADVWESKEGVLARYRDLDPEVRARHTFREYLYAELGKEEAKLARVRQAGPAGLDCWDKALDGVDTVEEARQLLEDIDTAIRAADDRRRALGMPVDDDEDGAAGVVLDGIAPLSSASAAVDNDGYLLPAVGSNTDAHEQAVAAMWGNNCFNPCSAANVQPDGYGFPFQQFNSSSNGAMEGYHLQMAPDMYNNGGLATDAYHYQQRDAGPMPHGYGIPCARASYFGMPSGYQMHQAGGGGAAQSKLPKWSADEPCHAIVPVPVPVEYPSSADSGLNYMDTPGTHAVQGSAGTSFAMDGSGNFINATPAALALAMGTCGGDGNPINTTPATLFNTMGGTGDNVTNPTPAQPLAMSYGGDMTVAGRYATQSGIQQLQFLSNLEDTQLNLWGN